MASLSDQLLTVAVLCYAIAMLGYAVEYAFGARSLVGRVARERELVGAAAVAGSSRVGAAAEPSGTSALTGPDSTGPDVTAEAIDDTADDGAPAGPPVSPRAAALAGAAALWLTVVGAVAQAGCLLARGIAAGRVPWGNMYEFVVAVCLVGVVAWLVIAFRRPVRHLGLFVTLVVVSLLGFAAVRLYTEAGPLMPALNSYWLQIHVSAAILATGVLLVGFVGAAMYLIRDRYDLIARAESPEDDPRPLRFPISLGPRLPDAETLERMTFRLHALAFPIWTFAIMAGAVWAEEAWTRYWGWDPKEVWAFISWVVYAAYLHARATAGWRRSTSAWIAVVGWATMLVNLFVVNLVIEGLHSYSGA
ncbi:MAG: c-type cytochrome biogenesis protein CcsB [Micromonosporaceae bacterium]